MTKVDLVSTGIILDGTYAYVLARYGSDATVVWYVGGLAGSYDLPATYGQGQVIAHYSLFRDPLNDRLAPANVVNVADNGSALALLGLGMASLGLARPKLWRFGASRRS